MRIYSMTATFGKLEHDTLVLEPGLNVRFAPNEWGKSTWCAFLMTMLYGMDTHTKSSKTALADKERFAPWSGSPMEGRVELNWNGRDITIERRTRGRIPMGEFRAFETDTGLDVPELTAYNCGEMLLGVEQSVFQRSGFIRLSDLPVIQDENMRARLNALVTTGDESDDALRLSESLRDLKNKCRYNRTGLLPQAIARRDAVEEKLSELDALDDQQKQLQQRLAEISQRKKELENHRAVLAYQKTQEDAQRIEDAQEIWEQESRRMARLEAACASLISREMAEQNLRELREWQKEWITLQTERRMLIEPKEEKKPPRPFAGMELTEAKEMVEKDAAELQGLPGGWLLFLVLGIFLLAAGVGLFLIQKVSFACADAAMAMLCIGLGIWQRKTRRSREAAMMSKYGSLDTESWFSKLKTYSEITRRFEAEYKEYSAALQELEARKAALTEQRIKLCGDRMPEGAADYWQKTIVCWDTYAASRQEAFRAQKYLSAVQVVSRTEAPPVEKDILAISPEETEHQLEEAAAEKQNLENRMHHNSGRMQALGDREALQRQLDQERDRIARLEDIFEALQIAQETLAEATIELQRRFAPRIAQRAQELLYQLTEGRYDRLALSEDFSLRAGARQEDTLREALWRSDGTVDQLYLALRLSVSEALTPEAPLILDDALVRFDDRRMEAALKLLKQMAEDRQIILFSCQARERQALKNMTEDKKSSLTEV